MISKTLKYYYPLIFFGLVYSIITFLIPPDPQALEKYKITAEQSRMISFVLAAVVIGLWAVVFYGFVKFKEYAKKIRDHKDGAAFSIMANAFGILALGLPIASLSSTLLRYFARTSADLVPITTIIANYISLSIPFIAFFIAKVGARKLGEITKIEPTMPARILGTAFFITLGVAYIYFTLNNPIRQIPPDVPLGRATFYLPDWLIVSTIILPYIYLWYNGLQAAFCLESYRSNVKGFLYKDALKYLSSGIASVIGSYIFVNFLSAFGSIFAESEIGPVLKLIAILLVVILFGYVLIAIGAKKLSKIEEI